MTRSLQPARTGLLPDLPYTAAEAEPMPPGMLASAHRLLRGRYLWVVMLGAMLAGGGAYAGYQLWEPVYQSVGQIRIAPTLPRILYSTEDQNMSGVYDGYIDTQTALMTSARLVDFANQSETWKAIGRGLTDEAIRDFRESLKIGRSKGSQIVNVYFSDTDPVAAQAAVKAVIESYMKIYGEEDVKAHETRLNVLEKRRITLGAELKSLQDRVRAIAEEHGVRSLGTVLSNKQNLLNDLEVRILQIQSERALLETEAITKGLLAPFSTPGTPAPGTTPGNPATAADTGADDAPELGPVRRILAPEQIAELDPKMKALIDQRDSTRLHLDKLREVRRDNHPLVIPVAKELNRLESEIEKRTFLWNTERTEANERRVREDIAQRVEILLASEKRLRSILQPLQVEVQEIGRKDLQIARLDEQIVDVNKWLKDVEVRLEQLNVESFVSGRVVVISLGDRPSLPVNKSARARQAAMGGFGGIAVAVGLFMLVGMRDRRTRYVDDVQLVMRQSPLLGVIPEIPSNGKDPLVPASAALAINQVRAMLQLGPVSVDRRVFAITSGSPGDGKTSVTLSLGTSFANAGARTLIIDFDLTGRHLSSRTGSMHRARLGDVLKRLGLIDDDQIQEAAIRARQQRVRIGRAMIDLGFVGLPDVRAALASQDGTALGLVDVLGGSPMHQCVLPTQTDRLFVLPVGECGPRFLHGVSPGPVKNLIERARVDYDVVIIDTGPLPASLEGSVVAAHCDEAIVVVSKDSQQASVERVLQHLRVIGTNVAGIVFNRATQGCVARYGSSSRTRSLPAPQDRDYGPDTADLGPLATATASTAMSTEPAVQPIVHGEEQED